MSGPMWSRHAAHAINEKVVGVPSKPGVCSCCSCPTRLAYGSTSFFRPEASWPIKWSFWQQDYLGIAELLISSPSELAKEDDVFQRGLV